MKMKFLDKSKCDFGFRVILEKIEHNPNIHPFCKKKRMSSSKVAMTCALVSSNWCMMTEYTQENNSLTT